MVTYNPDLSKQFNNYIEQYKDNVLKDYKISDTFESINNDPTRRYFETHLAFESLKSTIKNIKLDRLYYLYIEQVDKLNKYEEGNVNRIMSVLNGEVSTLEKNHKEVTELEKEYSEYFKRIKTNQMFTNEQGFSAIDRKKIKLIISCSFLSIQWAQSIHLNRILPLDIYGKDKNGKDKCEQGYFGSERGKILKYKDLKDQTVQSKHYGLIKGHMPVPLDDIIMSDKTFGFFKSSEQSKFDKDKRWVKYNFYQKVHPFSNSISGTALCVIRFLSLLHRHKIKPFTETKTDFYNFYRAFSSIIVFFSGGHSLYEIIRVLQLPEIIKEFPPSSGLDLPNAFISNVFIENNNIAFINVIKKTITYNNQYIKKCHLNKEIKKGVKLSKVSFIDKPYLWNDNIDKVIKIILNANIEKPKKSKKRKSIDNEEMNIPTKRMKL